MSEELHRPYIRKWVREMVEARTPRDEQGHFIDVCTGESIDGPYDLGHTAGHEFWAEQERAEHEGLSQKEFNDRMNDPSLYRLESPSSNRSHNEESHVSSEERARLQDVADHQSCAERAQRTQGSGHDGLGNYNNEPYIGHDTFQNGILEHGTPMTIYATRWDDKNLESGYFTDKDTIDQCSQNGILNSNKLGSKLQTAPSNLDTNGGDYLQKPICRAYDVDWDRLDALKEENPRVYNRLTNPDGKSPDSQDIKCAFGKVEANPQYGEGGANEYFIDREIFNEATRAGVFKTNPDESFSENKGNLQREPIANDRNYRNEFALNKNEAEEAESQKKNLSPEEINSQKAVENKESPYIAKPDPAYEYGKTESQDKAPESMPDKTESQDKAPESMPNKSVEREGTREEPVKEAGASKEMPNKAKNSEDAETDKNSESMPNKAEDKPSEESKASKGMPNKAEDSKDTGLKKSSESMPNKSAESAGSSNSSSPSSSSEPSNSSGSSQSSSKGMSQ